MTMTAVLAATALLAAFAFHIGTAFVAWTRVTRAASLSASEPEAPHVSIIIPVAHLEAVTAPALTSTFGLAYPNFDLIFCVPSADDPAVALVERLMSNHPQVAARLLVGREKMTFNPKIDNLEKGWAASADREWIIIADSNVLMPPDFVQRLLAAWRSDTGLTCSPPIGSDPKSFWGDVECAFLNTYQGRVQLASDALGHGFAHGKAMLFQRSLLDPERGLDTLKFEVAEDCAATKLVRSKGKRVRLVDRPFQQPVTERTFGDVWHRHLRWAQLRRQSFPTLFALELLTTSFVPVIAAAVLARSLNASVLIAVAASLTLWLAVEVALAHAAGWPSRTGYAAACICRDVLIAAMWGTAWFRTRYHWRENPVNMTDAAQPRIPHKGPA